MPKFIVSDNDSKLVSNFWQSLHSALITKLDFFSTFFNHNWMVNQNVPIYTTEDMRHACVFLER